MRLRPAGIEEVAVQFRSRGGPCRLWEDSPPPSFVWSAAPSVPHRGVQAGHFPNRTEAECRVGEPRSCLSPPRQVNLCFLYPVCFWPEGYPPLPLEHIAWGMRGRVLDLMFSRRGAREGFIVPIGHLEMESAKRHRRLTRCLRLRSLNAPFA